MGCYYNSSYNLNQLNDAIERASFVKTVSFYYIQQNWDDYDLVCNLIGGTNTKILEKDVQESIRSHPSDFVDENGEEFQFPHIIGNTDVVFTGVAPLEVKKNRGTSSTAVLNVRFSPNSFSHDASDAPEGDEFRWRDVSCSEGHSVEFGRVKECRYVQFRIKTTQMYHGSTLYTGDDFVVLTTNPAHHSTEWAYSEVLDMRDRTHRYFYYVWN